MSNHRLKHDRIDPDQNLFSTSGKVIPGMDLTGPSSRYIVFIQCCGAARRRAFLGWSRTRLS